MRRPGGQAFAKALAMHRYNTASKEDSKKSPTKRVWFVNQKIVLTGTWQEKEKRKSWAS